MRGKAANSCLPAMLTLQQVAVTESGGVVGLRVDPRCLRAAFDSSARWDLCGGHPRRVVPTAIAASRHWRPRRPP